MERLQHWKVGDPTAYLVADTLIALRRSDAETITIA